MFHQANDDQQEVLDALEGGNYSKERSSTVNVDHFITRTGVSFRWLHGFGTGKSIKIFDDVQPGWFSKKVIKLLTR
jgi:hypothetical protein